MSHDTANAIPRHRVGVGECVVAVGEELLEVDIMLFVAVGVALLLWGALVGRVGTKLGTLLAIVPVLVWFGVLAWFGSSGDLDSPAGDALPVYLVIGLLAFTIGVNLTNRSVSVRNSRRRP
ncbi:hypothetical protein [Microbacterium sp. ER1]|uniref:hypothetical protein n=1 Tax=Microbacterium sp. ER1 TaxID=1932846 RepID=UPI00201A9C74|nr:hypothetical protein [Microbacterium sp. ER1]